MSISELDFSGVPFVDHHAHALLLKQPVEAPAFRAHFAESHSPAIGRDFIGDAVHYRWAVRQLAAEFEVEPDETAVLQRRCQPDVASYVRDLGRRSHLECLLLDEGYPPVGLGYTTDRMQAMLGVPCYRMLRLETLLENLLPDHTTLSELAAAFDRALESATAQGYVSLKSIAAYRCGLQISPVAELEAEKALREVRAASAAAPQTRLTSKPIIDYFVWRAVLFAAGRRLPVQFHTGYGDPDLDLRLSNPLHLRPLFEAPELQSAPIVILHAGYPYIAEAAYLAAVYPNAYLDLPYSLPPLGLGELRRLTAIALEIAPAGKLLCSSDGTNIPEHHYLGAVRARRVLKDVLGTMVADGQLSATDAQRTGEMLLRTNAERLYRLPATEPAQRTPRN